MTVRSMTPEVAASQGGAVLRLSGASFGDATACAFEGDSRSRAGTTAFVSTALLLCEAPALAPGVASVRARASELEVTSTAAALELHPAAESRSAQPSQAVDTGGAAVKLLGHGFVSVGDDARCWFGTIQVAAAVAGARQVACVAPAHVAGSVKLLWELGALYDTGGVDFTYTRAPVIDAALPQPSRSGGLQFLLYGADLLTSLVAPTCGFGSDDVLAVPAPGSSGTLMCALSVEPSAGFVPLLLSDAALQDSILLSTPHASAFPRTLGAGPAAGLATGGVVVTLSGQALGPASDGDPWCSAANAYGSAVAVSSVLTLCETPAVFPGTVALHSGGSWGSDITLGGGAAFVGVSDPQVLGVTPSAGSYAGGTVVIVTGAVLDVTLCRFATITVAASEADSRLACTTPARAPGLSDMAFGVNAQQWTAPAAGALTFAHLLLPAVLSVSPAQGSVHGDASPDALMVATDATSSTGALPAMTCVFGAAASSAATPVSQAFWSCALPPGPLGFTTLQLQLAAAPSGAASGTEFTYTSPPSPLAVSPRRIGAAGGTLLHVSGYWLHGAAACVFSDGDGVAQTPTREVSSALVLCESPLLALSSDGSVGLSLQQSDAVAGNAPEGSIPIAVSPAVWVTGAAPSDIPPDGSGAPLVLTGTGLREYGDTGASCWLGTIGPIAALDVSGAALTCVPVAHAPGPLAVGASPLGEPAPWGRFPANVLVMQTGVTRGGEVALFPETVSASGGSTVRLTSALVVSPDTDLILVLGALPSELLLDPARAASAGPLVLPALSPGIAAVWLSNGASVLAQLGQVTVLRPPHVHGVQPVTGADVGGTLVTFTGAHFGSPASSWSAFFDQTAMRGGACFSSVLCIAEAPPVYQLGWAGGEEDARVVAAEVTNTPAGVLTADGVEFTYTPLPLVAAVDPGSGDQAGGTRATVSGGPFREGSALVCRFGTHTVRPAAVQSSAELVCVAPAMAPSTRPVYVSNNAADFSPTLLAAFASTPTVTLAYVLQQPGNAVALYTAAPVPPAVTQLLCLWGSQGSTQAMLSTGATSPTAAAGLCQLPSQGVGFTTIGLATETAQLSTGQPEFEFLPVPDALVATPNAASRLGGTVITLSGRDFGVGGGALPLIRFGDGGLVVPARVVSSVLVMVETPVATAAPSDAPPAKLVVAVSNVDAVFAPGAHEAPFTAVTATRLLSATPGGGSVRGGTVTMLSGQGFSSGDPQFCRFGTLGPIAADFVSDVVLRCTSPAHATGPPVQLAVSRANALDLATATGVTFEY